MKKVKLSAIKGWQQQQQQSYKGLALVRIIPSPSFLIFGFFVFASALASVFSGR